GGQRRADYQGHHHQERECEYHSRRHETLARPQPNSLVGLCPDVPYEIERVLQLTEYAGGPQEHGCDTEYPGYGYQRRPALRVRYDRIEYLPGFGADHCDELIDERCLCSRADQADAPNEDQQQRRDRERGVKRQSGGEGQRVILEEFRNALAKVGPDALDSHV